MHVTTKKKQASMPFFPYISRRQRIGGEIRTKICQFYMQMWLIVIRFLKTQQVF